MKALVVDDSRALRAIMKRALAQFGFEVVEAGDGVQALAELDSRGALDLALVDWNMPNMNGYDLVCAIRARPPLNRMPVMMVTTETEAGNVQRSLDAGANEYLMKPFTPEALRDKLVLLGLVAG